MKKIKYLIIFILAAIFIFGSAATILADPLYYQYTGSSLSGHTYGGTGVAKFNMTDGYTAFCVDINVTIQKNQNYIKLSLEEAETRGVLTNPGKVRAILNYSWNKTSKDEITAIQYALWHFMNGHNLPSSANNNVKNIYIKLISDTETPPIPASQEIEGNILTLVEPTQPVGKIFSFRVENSFSEIPIVIEVLDKNTKEPISQSLYTLIENPEGTYTFTWLDEEVEAEILIRATTLRNKSVNAWVFFAVDNKGDINKKLSQTVAGLKPSESFQSKEFTFDIEKEVTTTTTETSVTSTDSSITSVESSVTSVESSITSSSITSVESSITSSSITSVDSSSTADTTRTQISTVETEESTTSSVEETSTGPSTEETTEPSTEEATEPTTIITETVPITTTFTTESEFPQTGEGQGIPLWIPLLLAFVGTGSVIGAVIIRKKTY